MTTIEFWNLIVSSTATILAAIAILLYIILWYKDKSSNSYDSFDATYLDILKTGMENPSFRNPILTNDYLNNFSGDEKIKYYDYTSLYPDVQKYCEYPVGHPEIITENFKDLSCYFGFMKCKVLPPKKLYLLFFCQTTLNMKV